MRLVHGFRPVFLCLLMLKRFVIKKYVMAISASNALKKEKGVQADEVWLDDKWAEEQAKKTQDKTIEGFKK